MKDESVQLLIETIVDYKMRAFKLQNEIEHAPESEKAYLEASIDINIDIVNQLNQIFE